MTLQMFDMAILKLNLSIALQDEKPGGKREEWQENLGENVNWVWQ
jgi:hypothetical protein